MSADESLEKAVAIVNKTNRPDGRPLVTVVRCVICDNTFASHPQDVGLAIRRGRGRICPSKECQSESRRRRQRGEHADQDAVAHSLAIGKILLPSPKATDTATNKKKV
jgi:hypothetical protein